MGRRSRTDSELAQASDRIHEQIRHLTVLVNGLVTPSPDQTPICASAMERAFLHHACVLIYFLHPMNPEDDDVIAADFFGGGDAEWARLRMPPTERLALARTRAEREQERLRYQQPTALPVVDRRHVVEIANEISAGVSIFLRHVPAAHLGDAWARFRER